MKLCEHIKRIREYANILRIQRWVMRNRSNWVQLCSCMDVIEDSDLAIEAFLNSDYGPNKGEQYLAVYGVLQAMFVQQDAVFYLDESLGGIRTLEQFLATYPNLGRIRDIRNRSVGHATKKRGKKTDKNKAGSTSYHFISRPTLEGKGYMLLSFYDDGRSEDEQVDLRALVREQDEDLGKILEGVIQGIERQDRDHKEQFRMEKLAAIFPDAMNYYCEKIFEGINKTDPVLRADPREAQIGKFGISMVRPILATFHDALVRRGMDLGPDQPLGHDHELLEFALAELDNFFACVMSGQPTIDRKMAYILADFVRQKWPELRRRAEEIDEEYAS